MFSLLDPVQRASRKTRTLSTNEIGEYAEQQRALATHDSEVQKERLLSCISSKGVDQAVKEDR